MPAICKASLLPPSVRHNGIDIGRFIAILAVIALHGLLVAPAQNMSVAALLQTATRFAVPFFFLTSGYFLRPPGKSILEELLRVAYRLLPIFIVWLFFYIIVLQPPASTLHQPKFWALALGLGNPSIHLWFLPSLGLCLAILIVLRRFISFKMILFLALILFLIGLVFGPYQPVLHTPKTSWDTRNGPFFGMIFVVIGYGLNNSLIRLQALCNTIPAMIIALSGFVLMLLELNFLNIRTGQPFAPHDYVAGTLFYAIGIFLLFVGWQPKGKLTSYMASCGHLSLGIYCLHVLFLTWFETSYFQSADLVTRFNLIMAVAITTLFTVYALNKWRRLKFLFS